MGEKMMSVADFTLDALLVLAVLTFIGAWLWTRADLRKRRPADLHPKP